MAVTPSQECILLAIHGLRQTVLGSRRRAGALPAIQGRIEMSMKKLIPALALGVAAATMSAATAADEWPLVLGDYWEVSGIDLKDGGSLKYAEFLANEWKANLEFSKSKGWIKDYKIFTNVYARADEPDLYLVTIRENIESGAEGEKRDAEFMAWKQKSISQMQSESGNRAEYREVLGDTLLQELTFRSK
jgi:hypothetical protein